MLRLSAKQPSAQSTECLATEFLATQGNLVPNGTQVPSKMKSFQIKPKGGRKLLRVKF